LIARARWLLALLVLAKLAVGASTPFTTDAAAQENDADEAALEAFYDSGLDDAPAGDGALDYGDPDAGDAEGAPPQVCDTDELERREKALRVRNEVLTEREAQLRRLEVDLELLRDQLDKRVARLASIRDEIRSMEEKQAQGRAKALAKIYGKMKSRDAAPLVAELDRDIVREMFLLMKDKEVAGILAELPPEVAVAITEGMSKGGRPALGDGAESGNAS